MNTTNANVKADEPAKANTLPQLRKSHWAAKMKDICGASGGPKALARKWADSITDGDVILMHSRISTVLNQRASCGTSSLLVNTIEKLMKEEPTK